MKLAHKEDSSDVFQFITIGGDVISVSMDRDRTSSTIVPSAQFIDLQSADSENANLKLSKFDF
jgi:uncharacterized protein YlxP (DUF503 family)